MLVLTLTEETTSDCYNKLKERIETVENLSSDSRFENFKVNICVKTTLENRSQSFAFFCQAYKCH